MTNQNATLGEWWINGIRKGIKDQSAFNLNAAQCRATGAEQMETMWNYKAIDLSNGNVLCEEYITTEDIRTHIYFSGEFQKFMKNEQAKVCIILSPDKDN